MSLVLDSSSALSWFLPGQLTASLHELLVRVEEHGAWVPRLWYYEVANGLQTGIRAGRVTASFREKTLADLAILPIDTDEVSDQMVWTVTARLATSHGLTIYDATYLEIAMRRRLPLATLDLQLRAAATAEGVPLLGL